MNNNNASQKVDSSFSSASLSSSLSSDIVIDSLREDEVEDWLDHLVLSFAHKGTPRAYFIRHLMNDPETDFSAIVVARAPHRIISSVRVFLRWIFLHGRPCPMGGIGEVSTQPEFRGRGLAVLCLARAAELLAERRRPIASLHTSNAVDYYRSLGWKTVERSFAIFPVKRSEIEGTAEWFLDSNLSEKSSPGNKRADWTIEALDLIGESIPSSSSSSISTLSCLCSPSSSLSLLQSLNDLYNEYASRFNGPCVRTVLYWQQWICSDHRAAVSPILSFTARSSSSHSSPVLAYMFAQWQRTPIVSETLDADGMKRSSTLEQHLFVREFVCSSSLFERDGGQGVFDALLSRSLSALCPSELSSCHIRTPEPLLMAFVNPWRVTSRQIDRGYMYLSVDDSNAAESIMANAFERHVYFAADAF